MLASKFTFFTNSKTVNSNSVPDPEPNRFKPELKLLTDKEVYRPGDSVFITIEISNQISTVDPVKEENLNSFFIEKLGFEIVGIQKLDAQWFVTPKQVPGSKKRRGENVFLECSSTSMVSNQIISSGSTKTYVVRTVLPSGIPPSFKGSTIRYMYYIRSSLCGRLLMLENGHSYHESKDVVELEARIPLQIWVAQKSNVLLMEESLSDGVVPATPIKMDMHWKEMDGDSEWARPNDLDDGFEEGYESFRDEISSVSSYNPTKETIHKTFGSSLSLQSSTARHSTRDNSFVEGGRTSLSSTLALPRLSVAEVMYDSGEGSSSAVQSPSRQQMLKSQSEDDGAAGPSASVAGSNEPTISEGFIRGRSYNIRMDDQVLLRFSPRNSDSTYYFSDMIGGTITFFHEEGARRCLEVSITLETSETVNRSFVHPSRRNSPTITKVQSDHHEVVADLIQTSFLFSIPMDGPMSFSTPHVSVQWVLRFEFFTTSKNVDWTRYDHPLLVEGREKSEWVLPIVVHAPPPGATSHAGNNKSFSLDPLWVRT